MEKASKSSRTARRTCIPADTQGSNQLKTTEGLGARQRSSRESMCVCVCCGRRVRGAGPWLAVRPPNSPTAAEASLIHSSTASTSRVFIRRNIQRPCGIHRGARCALAEIVGQRVRCRRDGRPMGCLVYIATPSGEAFQLHSRSVACKASASCCAEQTEHSLFFF